jgi:hypothetical protein
VSVWRIANDATAQAAQAPTRRRRTRGSAPGQPGASGATREAIETLTRWIPSEILVLYVPAVTALAESSDQPSVALLIAMVIATPLFVLGARFATAEPITRAIWVAAGLAMLSFVIWSVTVPLSGWQRWDVIADNQDAVAIGAAVVGLLFGYFAEGLLRRVGT